MRYILRRPRAFWISVCNLLGLACSMAGVVLLFWYALPVMPPGGPVGYTGVHGPAWEAEVQHYNTLGHIGLGLVLVGTALEAVPPFYTAIGSWRRRPITPQVPRREETEPQPGKIHNSSPAQGGLQMSAPPQTDINSTRISAQTERVLHDFVRDAVSRLSQALNDAAPQSAPTFEDEIQFERGEDGHFRERKKHIWTLWPTLSPEWLHSLPDAANLTPSPLSRHCQLKQGWYPLAVGGVAVRCREVLGTPIGLALSKERGAKKVDSPELS
jgi:hypothetical protein